MTESDEERRALDDLIQRVHRIEPDAPEVLRAAAELDRQPANPPGAEDAAWIERMIARCRPDDAAPGGTAARQGRARRWIRRLSWSIAGAAAVVLATLLVAMGDREPYKKFDEIGFRSTDWEYTQMVSLLRSPPENPHDVMLIACRVYGRVIQTLRAMATWHNDPVIGNRVRSQAQLLYERLWENRRFEPRPEDVWQTCMERATDALAPDSVRLAAVDRLAEELLVASQALIQTPAIGDDEFQRSHPFMIRVVFQHVQLAMQ